ERELIINTALRGFVDGARIRDSITRLEAFADAADDGSKASINRSLARSLAKVGKADHAVRLAEEGLVLAREEGDVRAIGNAQLAAGEALRHAGRETDALPRYWEAIDLGKGSGNRDSEIWSRLGEASAYTQLGDFARARDAAAQAAKLT